MRRSLIAGFVLLIPCAGLLLAEDFTRFEPSAVLRAEHLNENFKRLQDRLQALEAQTGNAQAPVGAVVAWPADKGLIPAGWHVCDGREFANVPGGVDSSLQSVLSDGRLPDYRGLFLRGLDHDRDGEPLRDASMRDPDRPRVINSYQPDALAAHSHSITYAQAEWSCGTADARRVTKVDAVGANFGGRGNTGSNQGEETRPRNRAVHWIIRVRAR